MIGMKEDTKAQFRVLAKIMLEIEEFTVKLGGLPTTMADLILKKHMVSEQGEKVLLSMIEQSEKVRISDDRTMLLPTSYSEVIDV